MLMFIGPSVFCRGMCQTRSLNTIEGVDLNRAGLLMRRTEKLKPFVDLVARYESLNDDQKKFVERHIQLEAGSGKEYSAMLKDFAAHFTSTTV